LESINAAKNEAEKSERERRISFYERNGARKTNISSKLFDVEFDIFYLPIKKNGMTLLFTASLTKFTIPYSPKNFAERKCSFLHVKALDKMNCTKHCKYVQFIKQGRFIGLPDFLIRFVIFRIVLRKDICTSRLAL